MRVITSRDIPLLGMGDLEAGLGEIRSGRWDSGPRFVDASSSTNISGKRVSDIIRKALLQYVYNGNIDTWDYQWVYSIWANSGLSIAPKRNLVKNIGFNAEATHTKGDSVYASLKAEALDFPLVHPRTVIASVDRDELETRLRVRHSDSLRYPFNKYASSIKRLAKKLMGHGKTA